MTKAFDIKDMTVTITKDMYRNIAEKAIKEKMKKMIDQCIHIKWTD